ncbi:MAG: hypothetical protein E6154_02215, partial [Staphylococcus epidermidis]|nr:hypothetical protein [Staphylococcus epidermidis]
NSLCWGPEPQLALPGEFLSEILCVGAPNPNLLCLVNFSVKFFVLGPEPQLALSGEFLSEILYVKELHI